MRLLDEAGVAPLVPNLHGIALWVVPVLGLFELRRVVRTLAIVARRRQRRNEYRMPIDTPVVATDSPGPRDRPDRDLSPSGLGLELSDAARARHADDGDDARLPSLDDGVDSVDLDVCAQSCRPARTSWALGTRIVRCSDEAERRIVEYCYVVCQGERLRSGREVALPVPALAELPRRPSSRPQPDRARRGRALLSVAILASAYMVSRGLAKSGATTSTGPTRTTVSAPQGALRRQGRGFQ